MCGIFAYIGNKKNAPDIVFSGLKSLEYRGYDSWGVGVISLGNPGGKIKIKKRVGKIGGATVSDLPKGKIAFGHTRWATHGGVTQLNAHPQLDCTGKISVIHNGIVENYQEIKSELLKKGHKFISQTDTEVIAHLIEENLKKHSFGEALKESFNALQGFNAVIAIGAGENYIAAVKNGSPLVAGFGSDENFLASDASVLANIADDVYFLKDGEMALIRDKSIDIFNAKTGRRIVPEKQKISWKIENTKKGKYKHYMLKEIYEQSGILAKIAEASHPEIEELSVMIKKSRGTYLTGCGTSFYACMAGVYLFSKISARHVNAAVGSEFGYSLSFLNKDSLVIAFSQSGETMDILESVKKAKERKSKILSLVNVPGSTLYRLSDGNIIIGAGSEKAVASTKAFTAMVAYLVLLAYAAKGSMKTGKKVLAKAVSSVETVLSGSSVKNIKRLSSLIAKNKDIYVIGRGLSYPASLETALKIKEVSYIHAEGLAAGELKHGPLALIAKNTPCICFLPNDETYGANLAGAMEMKARGGFIIGISDKRHEILDYYIEVPDAKEATIIPNVVAAQILAYYLALEKGLDPDKPRNLAKSVTVK